ncbi:hypothetical protein [Selenomonas ruminantium]|uniref:hypothetical protein n=1 Tax=Selenomonas ruminantium TaxID=971 RepID=UPI0026EE1BB7|nr:hypothetical protein [Selenomonas ruminantium]
MNYNDFLKSKMVIAPKSGLTISRDEISDTLKPHQRDAVYWAVTGGRRAIFAAFGLGKTIIWTWLKSWIRTGNCLLLSWSWLPAHGIRRAYL